MKLPTRKPPNNVATLADATPSDGPDPRALEAAILQVEKTRAHIAETRQQLAAWQKEYDDFMLICDPNDEADLRIASGVKTRIEICPSFIKRAEERLEGLIDAVLRETNALEKGLLEAGGAEYEARADAIAALLKSHCLSDAEARGVAQNCGCFRFVSFLDGRLATQAPPFGMRSTYAEAALYDEPVMSRARQILASYKVWADLGRRFIPDPLPEPLPLPVADEYAGPSGAPGTLGGHPMKVPETGDGFLGGRIGVR